MNNSKQYDLENRTLIFAKNTVAYVSKLNQSISNREIGRQLIRSAGSVGANYIEANEALSRKDFKFRIKICRKEAKESRYWLNLSAPTPHNECIRKELVQESTELTKIFGSIIEKVK